METLKTEFVKEQVNHIIGSFNCAAKASPAIEYFLTYMENGKFRFMYAHENNTPLNPPKLQVTGGDIAKLNKVLEKNRCG